MIDLEADIQEEAVLAVCFEAMDEVRIADKLLDSIFSPTQGSKDTYCIHQSRTINCR